MMTIAAIRHEIAGAGGVAVQGYYDELSQVAQWYYYMV